MSAQGGEDQQGQEYRHSAPGCGLEERLSLESTGPNPRETWCVSPGGRPALRGAAPLGRGERLPDGAARLRRPGGLVGERRRPLGDLLEELRQRRERLELHLA